MSQNINHEQWSNIHVENKNFQNEILTILLVI